MPFKVTQQLFANETLPADLCPYGCIEHDKAASANGPQFKIDAELCTDCGACALACPGKFEYERAFSRCEPPRPQTVYGPYVGSLGGWDGNVEVAIVHRKRIPGRTVKPRVARVSGRKL